MKKLAPIAMSAVFAFSLPLKVVRIDVLSAGANARQITAIARVIAIARGIRRSVLALLLSMKRRMNAVRIAAAERMIVQIAVLLILGDRFSPKDMNIQKNAVIRSTGVRVSDLTVHLYTCIIHHLF